MKTLYAILILDIALLCWANAELPPMPTSAPVTTTNSVDAIVRIDKIYLPATITHVQLIMKHKLTGERKAIYEGKVRRLESNFWTLKTFDNGYLLIQETSKLDLTFRDRFMVYIGTNWVVDGIQERDE